MDWSGRRTGSSQWKRETTADVRQSGFILVSRQFSAPTKWSLARIDNRAARAARKTRSRCNQIGPLDHNTAKICVSLVHTSFIFSAITKLIKSWKPSNKSLNYNLLNRINKMYKHDFFYLQQAWEAWLAPVGKQTRTTNSQLTPCAK